MDTGEFDMDTRHPRSIIHLDVDCFYAQVETVRNPEFAGKPLGVQQKNIVVTSNYIAREFGIKKCMPVDEAMLLCPGLILVRGEDLTNYRRMSTKISEILLEYTPLVERLGLDESFVDVSRIVEGWRPLPETDSRLSSEIRADEGEIFGSTEVEECCPCGCHSRLRIAAKIALEMRQRIYKELGLTCSAGIGHNKLICKLAGSLHKPNNQTLVYPWAAATLLTSIGTITKIPGIGPKTLQLLTSNGIKSVDDLRRITLEDLQVKIGRELSRKLKDNAEGMDDTVVKASGKPQSIGIEDGFNNVSLVAEVESRLGALLRRLTELANEDGRIPVALRITVRKNDSCSGRSSSKRETRQCPLPQHLLPSSKSGPYDYPKMLSLAMKLFHRAVDVTRPFHLTLLGVAFTKFEERTSGRSSITSFLRKQVAVQSVLDISSESVAAIGISDTSLGSPMSINQDSSSSNSSNSNDASEHEIRPLSSCQELLRGASSSSISGGGADRHFKRIGDSHDNSPGFFSSSSFGGGINATTTTTTTPTPTPTTATSGDEEDIGNEVEPSPKKTKLEVWLSGRRESPSNEMAGLRLGPSSPMQLAQTQSTNDSNILTNHLPINLPRDVENSWQTTKTKPNNILKYFIANK